MSNSATAQEPSMEEILASIRRIITDEQGGDATPEQVSEAGATDVVAVASEEEADTVSGGEPMSADDLDALFASDGPASVEPASENISEDDLDALFASDPVAEPEPEEEPASADDDVMELTDAEMEADGDDEDLGIVEGMDIMFDEMDEAEPEVAAPPPPAPVAAVPDMSVDTVEALVSDQAASSVSGAFANLSGMLVNNQAKSMEDLMKEMLRPMLQSWLDQNLPPLVEKMVAAEIRRLSGKS